MFWTGAGAGLLSGLGSLASGLFNTFTGQKQSKELMDYQYKLQQEGIDRQNFYNSPAQQMERLKSAGLSPNLVYGSGVDGNQSSAASPSITNVRGQMGNPLQDAVTQYQNARALNAEIDSKKQSTEEAKARTDLTNAKLLGELSDSAYRFKTLDYRIEQAKQDLALSVAREYNIYSDTRLKDNQLQNMWAELDLLKARKNLTDNQAATELVRKTALEEHIKVDRATVRRIAAEIPYIKAGTDLREQAAKIQGVEFEAGKAGDEWLAEHPKVAIVYNLLCKMLGVGKDVANIVKP